MSLRDTLNSLRKWGKKEPPQPQKKETSPEQENHSLQQTIAEQSQSTRQTLVNVPARRSQQPASNLSQLGLQSLQNLQAMDELGLIKQPEPPKAPPVDQTNVPTEVQVPLTGMEGQVINGLYEIERLLAQGGMGQVFLARRLTDDLKVVFKLLIKQPDRESTEYNRFLQEMLISGRLRHPNLIKVYDYSILSDGEALKPYMVMEFVEGQPLRNVLRKEGTLPLADAARVIIQACDGLYQVHEKGVVHRDLKPENLMVRGDYQAIDNVKILDFGIAQLQNNQFKFEVKEDGLAVGSVGYMSPEQICAQPVDHRTDIYSLGLILYEAITGHPPFTGSTRRETMAMHVQAKHMPPSVMATIPMGEEVDRIMDRAIAKHPNDRYANVRELQNDLQTLVILMLSRDENY